MTGLGAVVVGIAVIALLIFAAILITRGRTRSTAGEEAPQNLQPFLTDDEMENKRLTKVLVFALISVGVLALVVPVYYLGEANRQAEATEKLAEVDIEEGEHWFEVFSCVNCHGVGGVGGGVAFVEPRSGVETTWAVPSLNDVFYRYDEDEIRFWIEFGRGGTPMPAAGLEGGGSMTSQEIDQTIAYLRSIQVSQEEAVAQATSRTNLAAQRYLDAEASIDDAIAAQQAELDEILATPDVFAIVQDIPGDIALVLSGSGTCTAVSAELVTTSCEGAGADADRDGLADAAELELTDLFNTYGAAVEDGKYLVVLDPDNAFSVPTEGGEPESDLEVVDRLLNDITTEMINIEVVTDANEAFAERSAAGLDYLEQAKADANWQIDLGALATEVFDGDMDLAQRSVALFNGQCARCHTAGYSAGTAFEQEAGSGAWAPSLRDGKAVRQFPSAQNHSDFVISGTERAVRYGVNGLGNGWMPGFGFILSQEDIDLIVAFERWL